MQSPAPARAATTHDHPRSTASIAGHPLHPMLVPFPIVCFLGALLTDIAYSRTANQQWSNFSVWLITAGLVMGALAALTGIIDYAGDRRVRQARPALPHMLLNITVYGIQLFNVFVHSRDGWTAVVPTGLILSAVSAVLLVVSAWLGGSLSYRYGVGVGR
jgi:uncharacterized membrane protein